MLVILHKHVDILLYYISNRVELPGSIYIHIYIYIYIFFFLSKEDLGSSLSQYREFSGPALEASPSHL